MKNIFNHKKYVGCTVYDDILGKLVILETNGTDIFHPVSLKDLEGAVHQFSHDGISSRGLEPTLRWQPTEVEFDYGEPPWVADWSDEDQRKYFVMYVHEAKEWSFDYVYTLQNPDITYMSKSEAQKLANFNNKNNIKP